MTDRKNEHAVEPKVAQVYAELALLQRPAVELDDETERPRPSPPERREPSERRHMPSDADAVSVG